MGIKKETLEEFLARGGKIDKIDTVVPEDKRSVHVQASTKIISYAEADLLYGEKQNKTKKNKKPNLSKVNVNVLPENVRKALGL